MEHLKIHVQLKLDFKTRLVKIMILNNNQNHPRVMKLEIKVQLNGNAWGKKHTWVVGWLQRVFKTALFVRCFASVQRTSETRSPVATSKPVTWWSCGSPIAQWLERPTGIWKVLGSEHFLIRT